MDRQETAAISCGQVESLIGRRRHLEFTQFIYLLISKAGLTLSEFLGLYQERS